MSRPRALRYEIVGYYNNRAVFNNTCKRALKKVVEKLHLRLSN